MFIVILFISISFVLFLWFVVLVQREFGYKLFIQLFIYDIFIEYFMELVAELKGVWFRIGTGIVEWRRLVSYDRLQNLVKDV